MEVSQASARACHSRILRDPSSAVSRPLAMRLAFASLATAILASTTSAAFTQLDTKHDGYAVYLKSSLSTISEVVRSQNDAEISGWFDAANKELQSAIDGGTITMPTYLSKMKEFYLKANAKNSDFGDKVSTELEAKEVFFHEYVAAAPEAWCDFFFDIARDAAKASTNPDLPGKIDSLNKEIENDIKNKVDAAVVNDKLVAFYVDVNVADSKFLKTFDAKIASFGAQFTSEVTGKKITVSDGDEEDAEVDLLNSVSNGTDGAVKQSGSVRTFAVSTALTVVATIATISLSVFL